MRPHRAVVALVLALVLVGCAGGTRAGSGPVPSSSASESSFPLTMRDDDGVSVTLQAPPRRIITFAPSATEIVFALGLGDRLVGVSGPYDDYPPAAKRIQEVGGAGDFGVDPNIEKVVALRPDLFLTIEGGDQWKARLRSLGVPVFTINSTSLDDTFHDIETVGRLTGAEDAARALVGRLRARDESIEARIAGQPPVSCFFEVYYPPLTTVGPHTFIADLLRRAGCRSVSDRAKSDYPQWSVDDLVREAPEVYLVSSESGASAAAVARRPGFDAIAAVARGNVRVIDSDLVSRPGPRIVDGLRALARALHPDAFA
ncbi:MAG TPA: helical backbone metal receptor [Actinomycetota bacterium]|nr:helical backbone metal receptor [Actinomycetota bacterium]